MRNGFPIVGVGASAGGLEAVSRLLRALPPRPGMSFVLIQHLSPTGVSNLPAILSKSTGMAVRRAEAGVKARPDFLYIVPPDRDVVIRKGVLRLVARPVRTSRHSPIDLFLASLAADQGPRAMGIILSGEASDGTAGLETLKAAGGITFAQDLDSAAHPSMPLSAASSGCVDFVLSPERIAEELTRIGRHPYLNGSASKTAYAARLADEAALNRIFILLRKATGVEFTHYKRTTIHRRIQRRMALQKLDTFESYAALLEERRDELDLLFDDLLIHVTSFFRDPAMFKALARRVYPKLLRGRAKGPVRIWIPGCSTGEEAYSHAINVLEFLGRAASPTAVQIFATDVNDRVISKARQGFYSDRAVLGVDRKRLKRYFVRKGRGYKISSSIRDICVFARHDLTCDPPFSNMDLISCRNVMIYLDSALQKKVVPFMHYALRPGGFLVLGGSEMIGDASRFFLLDKKNRIYSRKPGAAPAQIPLVAVSTDTPIAPTRSFASVSAYKGPDLQQEIDRVLLERYAPAGVMIDDRLEILQFRGQTSPFLEPAPGKASLNLLKMAREGLLLQLNSAVREARETAAPVRREGIAFSWNGQQETASFEIIPFSPTETGRCFLVLFQKGAAAGPDGKPARHNARKLEHELASARSDLRTAFDEQLIADEELKSANEELQSSNEELVTSKEELQSSNEELQSSNDELNHAVLELTRANDDWANFIASTRIPCVVLSADLNIRRFTPAAAKIFNLLPGDIGRPISQLRPALRGVDVRRMAVETLNGVKFPRREIRDRSGRWHLLIVRPYRTGAKKTDGVTIVLINIDEVRRGQERLEHSRKALAESEAKRLRVYVESAPTGILAADAAGRIVLVNARLEAIFGYRRKEILGKPVELLVPKSLQAGRRRKRRSSTADAWARAIGGNRRQLSGLRKDGSSIPIEVKLSPIRADADGWIVATVEDIASRVQMQQDEAKKNREQIRGELIADLAHELKTPLATLRASAETLLHRELGVSKRGAPFLNAIESQTERLSMLVSNLLQLSSLDAGYRKPQRERLSLSKLVGDSVRDHKFQAKERGLDLRDRLEPGIVARVDCNDIHRAIDNLIDNAIHYNCPGGKIIVSLRRVGSAARLTVQDTGIGIVKSDIPKLFGHFHRTRRARKLKSSGVGLGLAIVKQVAESHGGWIRVSSLAGRGSTFRLSLPLA